MKSPTWLDNPEDRPFRFFGGFFCYGIMDLGIKGPVRRDPLEPSLTSGLIPKGLHSLDPDQPFVPCALFGFRKGGRGGNEGKRKTKLVKDRQEIAQQTFICKFRPLDAFGIGLALEVLVISLCPFPTG